MPCSICGAAHTACPGTVPGPQFVLDLETPMATNLWTADRRLYLNAAGAVVEANDPTRVSLLVAQGGTIPLADAERYGLVGEKAKAAPANKAKAKAPENK